MDFCASGGEANYDATLRLVMRAVIEEHDDDADGILGVVGRSLYAHSRTDPERLCCGVHYSRLVAGAACGAYVACHVVGGDDSFRTVIGPAVGVIVVVEQNAHGAGYPSCTGKLVRRESAVGEQDRTADSFTQLSIARCQYNCATESVG